MKIKNTSIASFFKEAFNIEWENMKINEEIDVANYNKCVEAYNDEINEKDFYQVTKIIRKPNTKKYIVIGNGNTFNCSGDHKVAMKLHSDKKDFTYMKVSTLINKKFLSFDKNEQWVETTVKKTNDEIPILDFEVDKVHNYYSNNILSHNTMFGNPETTPGGRALKFYSSVRLEVRKVEYLRKSAQDEPHGLLTRVKAVKNKTASPFRKGEVEIVFGKGIQFEKEYVDFAIEYNIIDKAASWFSYGKEFRLQGKDNVTDYLRNNPKTFNEIKEKVNKAMGILSTPVKEEEQKKESKSETKRKKVQKESEEVIELDEQKDEKNN